MKHANIFKMMLKIRKNEPKSSCLGPNLEKEKCCGLDQTNQTRQIKIGLTNTKKYN